MASILDILLYMISFLTVVGLVILLVEKEK